MQRKLLIALTTDMTSRSGLRFVSAFFSPKQDIGATLFHVAFDPRQAWSGSGAPAMTPEVARQAAGLELKGRRLLEEAKEFLVRQGFSAEAIDVKLQFMRSGTAFRDIVQEGVSGSYDAVVLGHGGYTLIDAMLRGSVSRSLLETRGGAPIWINRQPGKTLKDVLLCVDGSDESLRAADHVGFMLATQPRHAVHILHVHDPTKVEPLEYEDVVCQARQALEENGIEAGRIAELVRRGSNPARIIMEEVERGCYAAVAMGTTGADQTRLKRFFMGSVSLKVFKSLSETSLWVCH